MARRIATVSGYALRPGVSGNQRLYTRDHIARAVAEAQEAIAAGTAHFVDLSPEKRDGPNGIISQRTHHGAEDDSTRIVGRVTSLTLEDDGSARFTADLADTPHGRAIDSLVRPKRDPDDPDDVDPFLKGVSIRGAWSGKVSTVMHDGMLVEEGENLHIFGLDYTATPGIPGAEIDGYRPAGSGARESMAGMRLIYESISEGQVETTTIVEEKGAPPTRSGKPAAPPTKAPAGTYADPGYQGDKAKRYPLDTKKRTKAAWSYINQAENARNYTSAQLKRIKGRIRAALKKFGVEVSADESWLITRGELSESVTENLAYSLLDGNQASFHVTLDNGMVCVTVASCAVDPHDLDALGRAAMSAACAAMDTIDPDCDGDMDVPGAPAEDTDDDTMETTATTTLAVTEKAKNPPAPEAVADELKGASAMNEATTQASEKTAATTASTAEEGKKVEPTTLDLLSVKFDKLTDAISGLVTKMTAPVAATESAPATVVKVEEAEDQRITRLVEERMTSERTKIIQDLVESGQGPGRKGLVAPVTETTATRGTTSGDEYPADWPTENGQPIPPHKLTEEQFRTHTRPMLEQAVLGHRSIYRDR